MSKTVLAVVSALLASATVTANAQWARVLTTSGDRSYDLVHSAVQATSASANVTVNTGTKYQEIDGFGYAITYAACYNLMQMSESTRDALLKRTFSSSEGYGASYVRISIGTNDFSSAEYTLCDTQGPSNNPLQYFGLHSDEINYVIPMLQKIKALNPNVKIIATPWTPPRWMKTSYSWTGGQLSSSYYDAYGDYFVKFIQTMKGYGLDIYAVTPQNEPMNTGNSASCYMPWETEADFVSQSLAPKIKAAGLSTKIYLWDHNYNYDDVSGQNDYPYYALQRMGTSFSGYDLVAGSAWHKYTGYDNDWTEMQDIYYKTGKDNLFTEASIGTWNNGDDLSGSLARDMRDLVIHPSMGFCRGSLAWNFALSTSGTPYRPGGCSTCRGAISVGNNGGYYTCNSHYYIMAQASAAVKSGAYRVGTSGSTASNVYLTAYLNTNGTVGVLISNMNSYGTTVNVSANGYVYPLYVPALGVTTAMTGLSQTDANTEYASSSTTIYFDNSSTGWSTPYVFTWSNSATGDNGWPGVAMTNVSGNIWKYEVTNNHNMGLFNAGDGDATKTSDFSLVDGHVYTTAGDQGEYVEPAETTATIYFDNSSSNWGTPYVFTWSNSATGDNGWPGVAMTNVSGNIWKYEVTHNHNMGLFNAGDGDTTKTSDFSLVDGHVYTTAGDQGSYDSYVVTSATCPYYITGTMSSWATPGADGSYAMTYDGDLAYANVTYSVRNSSSNPDRFGLYYSPDGGWGTKFGVTSGLGTSSNPLTGPVTALQLVENGSSDLYFSFSGTYRTLFDPSSSTLTIIDPSPAARYLSGSFNSWTTPGSNSAYLMTYGEDGYYTFTVYLSGSDRLKIYGNGWNDTQYGRASTSDVLSDSNTSIQLQVTTESSGSSYDINYQNLSGTYTFRFNPTSLVLTISKLSSVRLANVSAGVEGISTDICEKPIYYNMMGVRVDNPSQGIYIRVQGSRRDKVKL